MVWLYPMALDKASLQKHLLEDYFTRKDGESFVTRAKYFARLYRNYAAGARSCQGIAPLALNLDAAEIKLAATLAMSTPRCKNPASFTVVYSTALAAFWMLPPITFVGGPSPGAIVAAVPATLQAALLGVLASSIKRGAKNNAKLIAADWAKALDGWTRTVVVAHGPVPACSAPLV
jgi:hypothetical protein